MYIMSPDCFDTVFLSSLGDALKSLDLYFQPLEIVSRYRDPQPQVDENYAYLFNMVPDI